MKVLAIGGGGGMGRSAARTALGFDFVEEIVLAGIDFERAQRFAASLNDPRIRAIRLDVTDAQALREAMHGADVVLNTAGPFFRFGVPVLEAAIETGKAYCDICDDWEPTLAMLGLHERARERGVTAVIGLGASPGIANMLAVKAAAALDEVDELVSAWKLSGAANVDDGFSDEPGADVAAAAVHLMHCLSEQIRVVRDGRPMEVTPLEQFSIDYPGYGPVDVWTIGHPEAVTLPRRFPELRTCYNGMLGVGSIVGGLRLLAGEIRAGRMSLEDAAAQLLADGDRAAEPHKPAQDGRPSLPGILAYASGTKNGRPARAGASISRVPAGGMAGVTGVPLALFLPLLRQGAIQGHGVFAPEQAIDADTFFQLLDGYVGPDGTGLTVTVSE